MPVLLERPPGKPAPTAWQARAFGPPRDAHETFRLPDLKLVTKACERDLICNAGVLPHHVRDHHPAIRIDLGRFARLQREPLPERHGPERALRMHQDVSGFRSATHFHQHRSQHSAAKQLNKGPRTRHAPAPHGMEPGSIREPLASSRLVKCETKPAIGPLYADHPALQSPKTSAIRDRNPITWPVSASWRPLGQHNFRFRPLNPGRYGISWDIMGRQWNPMVSTALRTGFRRTFEAYFFKLNEGLTLKWNRNLSELGAAGVENSEGKNTSRPVSRVRYGIRLSRTRDSHSSGTPVARRLSQPTRTTGLETGLGQWPALSLFGLAPGGFTMPSPLPATRWALTPPFHPYRGEAAAVCSLWHFP